MPVESNAPKDDKDQPLQGEGNYAAARRHRESVEKFVESGRVEPAARDAEPDTPEQAEALKQAEERGRRPAKD